jgi:peptidoglycan/xylan/chitin deacetylase (PgdA/CDA1 family)
MIRRLGKTLYACAYTWSGAAQWNQDADPQQMPFIVGYHRVVDNFERSARRAIPPMLISTAMLERHLDWLGRRFEFVSLDEVGANLESGRRFKKPAAAITFDDGYSDVYRCGYPILRRKGIPFAVFVVSGLVGTTRLQLYDRLYLLMSRLGAQKAPNTGAIFEVMQSLGLDCSGLADVTAPGDQAFHVMRMIMSRLPQSAVESLATVLEKTMPLDPNTLEEMAPLTWSMIEEMHQHGITIGSHTVSHALLTGESTKRIRYELRLSKQTLESRLKSTVSHFAYPDGRFNPAVVRDVQAAGYRYAYGICRARDPQYPLLTIPRKVLWEKACVDAMERFSPVVMNCQVYWAFDEVDCCEHDHGARQTCQVHLNTA